MNKCDTCKYAEWDWSELEMIEICTDCKLGFRNKFESEDDCGRFSPNSGSDNREVENK